MAIVLNGKNRDIEPGMTIASLLESMSTAPESVVVECNKEIIPAEAFGETVLNDGDTVEVLRFVGGG